MGSWLCGQERMRQGGQASSSYMLEGKGISGSGPAADRRVSAWAPCTCMHLTKRVAEECGRGCCESVYLRGLLYAQGQAQRRQARTESRPSLPGRPVADNGSVDSSFALCKNNYLQSHCRPLSAGFPPRAPPAARGRPPDPLTQFKFFKQN